MKKNIKYKNINSKRIEELELFKGNKLYQEFFKFFPGFDVINENTTYEISHDSNTNREVVLTYAYNYNTGHVQKADKIIHYKDGSIKYVMYGI